jgi:hypothetical protein
MRVLLSILPALLLTLSSTIFAQNSPVAQTLKAENCSLSGTVVRSGEKPEPIRRAGVLLLENTRAREPLNISTMTDDAGNFAFDALPAGRDYFIRVQKAGFGPAYFNGSRRLVPASRISCDAGRTIKGYNIQMAPLASLSGDVKDDEGELLARAPVDVYMRTSSGFLKKVISGSTDSRGALRATFPPGRYIFRARAPVLPGSAVLGEQDPKETGTQKRELAPTYYPGVTNAEQAIPVQLRAGEDTSISIQLVALPLVTLAGRISGWRPEISGTVALSEPGSSVAQNAAVDENGNFKISRIFPGKYTLDVSGAQYSDEEDDAHDLHYFAHAVIEVPEQGANVSLALTQRPPNRTFMGVVKTDSKAPLAFDTLRLGLIDPARVKDLSVDGFEDRFPINADGTFTATVNGGSKVYPGTESENDGWREWFVKSILLDGRDITDTGLSSTDRGKSLQIILSDASGSVDGVAVDSESKPVADAYVMMFPDGKSERYDLLQYTKADANGRFSIRGMRPMDYVVVAMETEPWQGNLRDPIYVADLVSKGTKVTVEARSEQKVKTIAITIDSD